MTPINVLPLMVCVWAARACFTRPDFPTERISYPVPTPSAARGVLEAIYWKPQFNWQIREIRVLNPIRYGSETRNEVAVRASRTALNAPFVVDGVSTNRLQRATRYLTDVRYVIVAEAVPHPYSSEELFKHAEIFTNRCKIGQCFTRPYLGCREYSCDFALATGEETPIKQSMDLGRMPFDMNFRVPGMKYESHRNNAKPVAFWYEPRMEQGIVKVPHEQYKFCGGSRGSDREQPPMPPEEMAG